MPTPPTTCLLVLAVLVAPHTLAAATILCVVGALYEFLLPYLVA